jgi:D-glycerate 3-kinase
LIYQILIKQVDDRFPKKYWYKIKEKPDVIIFEGWCVGAKAEEIKLLKNQLIHLKKQMIKSLFGENMLINN